MSKNCPPATVSRRQFLTSASVAALGTNLGATGSAADVVSARDWADVIIWDSTPAGLITAIAAARAGQSVILVSEDRHVGGMQTSGLGNTNAGQRETVGGLAREFHRRILDAYRAKYGDASPQVKDSSNGFFFEPHMAEQVYLAWLAEAGVTCVMQEVVQGVERQGTLLTGLRTASGRTFRGRVFVDASYEGDLLQLAGCSYHLGRESRQQYGEPLAGVRYPPERLGQEDHKLQPFDYRCCLTDVDANRVPFSQPPGYDPAEYAYEAYLMRRRPPRSLGEAMIPLNWMPNRKTDSRTAQWPGHNWDYIQADRPRRREIEQAHRRHSQGYLWYVMTDPAVPQAVREQAARFGLAKDEFVDNEHWPYHIYVREGRRLVGGFVMTQRDCVQERFKPDSVGLCSWYLDVHPVEILRVDDEFHPDGSINLPVKPFEVPYRALLPKAAEVSNLLVPVGLSASHVAFSSIRVEPVWMILGHACGVAAALSLETGAPLHAVSRDRLRERLIEQGQIVDAREFNDVWPRR